MNFQDAVAILSPELSNWTRAQRMDAIMQAIRGINSDALEARDILGVLIDTLKYRYDESALADVYHEYRQLCEALEEFVHEESVKEEDPMDAYRAWRERREE